MNPMQIARIVGVVAIVAVLAFIGNFIHGHGKQSVQLEWDAEKIQRSQELAAAQARVRDLENQLVTDVADIRKETNEKLTSLSSQRDALAKRVRLAEARARVPVPAAAPAVAEAGPVDPQPELLGSLGSTDVDEAYRADLIRLELLACYAQYDGAAEALRKLGQ